MIGSWLDKKYSENSWYNKNELTLLQNKFPYNLYEINCINLNEATTTILSILQDYKKNITHKNKIILNTNKKLKETSNSNSPRSCFSSWLSCIY